MQRMRRLRFCFRLVLCLLLPLSLPAWPQTARPAWTVLGPEGGDARSLALDPRDPSRVYLGTSAGQLYVSQDAGAHWNRLAYLGGRNDYVLDHVIVDPADSSHIYVAAWSIEDNSAGDLFVTRDGGKTWNTLPALHGKSIRSFAMAASDPKILVAGTLDGVFRSRDAGQTWERISPANHAEIKNIESLAVDPGNPDVIYAGTWHLPWKTDDGGRNWHSIKNGVIDDSDVFSIIVDPVDTRIVYASACSGIYKSESAGELFHKVQGMPFSARRTRVLRQDPSNSLIVYAGTTEGLWKSTDAGATWGRITPPNVIVNDVSVDPVNPARLLLATDRGGILASNDSGQSFTPSNSGFSHRQVASVVTGRGDPATLYAGVVNDKEFGGVFVSHDGGAHWQQMNAGLSGDDIFSLAQAESGELLAGTNRGVLLYDPKTARWQPANLVLNEKITTIARRVPKSKKPKLIEKREVVRGEIRGRVTQVAVTPREWLAATAMGLFVSLDQGRSWHGGPVIGQQDFFSVAATGDEVAAATPSGVSLSHDGGKTWTVASVPSYVTRIFGVTLAPNRLWIMTREGAFYSPDSGQTWSHIIVGIPGMQAVSIHYDAAAERTLAVASNGEVFASRDDGATWTRAADAGWPLRSVRIAGNRLLGITPFSGIVASPVASAEQSPPASTTRATSAPLP
jgi:photosystem II stability/assembly factor-like uncharacterized protein